MIMKRKRARIQLTSGVLCVNKKNKLRLASRVGDRLESKENRAATRNTSDVLEILDVGLQQVI